MCDGTFSTAPTSHFNHLLRNYGKIFVGLSLTRKAVNENKAVRVVHLNFDDYELIRKHVMTKKCHLLRLSVLES